MSEDNDNKFYDLHEDTIETIENLMEGMAIPFAIKIKYMGNTKMKQTVKLQKMSDVISHISHLDLIIFVNEDYFIKLEDKTAEILIYQELDRLEFNLEKGTFKIGKFQLQTTTGVLKKYGIDAVSEANQLTELLTQQKADQADEDVDEAFEAAKQSVKSVKKDVEFLS